MRVLHESDKMKFVFQYNMKYLTEKHAEEFVTLMKNIGDALLEEKILY